MLLLMFSLFSSIIFGQINGGQSIPPIESPTFTHNGASHFAGADSCRSCHIAGNDMTLSTQQLCFDCHDKERAKATKNYQHPDIPNEKFPSLKCEGCHRLHQAYSKPLLVQSQTGLCFSCHPATRDHNSHPIIQFDNGIERQLVLGADGKIVTCASHCHDMHGTDYKYLCTKEPGRELCISCHKEFQ
jgi:predicted CXXCH cytochrome family protein